MNRSNMKQNLARLASLLFLGSSLYGCNYNDLKNAPPVNGKGDRETFQSVDFQTVKTKVIDAACIRCHSGAAPKGGVRLETYADVFSQAANVRLQVETGAMPPRPPGLSVEQKSLLFAWVDSGAPETTVVTPAPVPSPPAEPGTPPPTPTPAATPVVSPMPTPATLPDFATVSRDVFVPHCLKCHDNKTQKGDVNLEVYALAKAVTSEIAFALDTDDMPRKAPALPPELKAIVYAWIDGGAPEFVP
ncbi:MAG: hypothetical protein U1E10_15675 [Bdellovibrionales bacterium]|nr:hypothetical protein [Bdellovibrionales bacterium]